MQPQELKRILTAFANDPADVDVRQGKAVAQIQDDIIEVSLERDEQSGELVIRDNGVQIPPIRWLLTRVAKLPLLADRVLALTPPSDYFVTPSGSFENSLKDDATSHQPLLNVVHGLANAVATSEVGSTNVIYLTSDAGEGKTTLINHLARIQAEKFKARTSQSLLIPIPLGGKAFLHFDDVVVATLVNRFRFNYYYYEGFLELVRLGAIVPAFDGFEEMFIEGSSGEAVSALGNLIDALDSSGTLIVAARKAFFEYQSFRTQARLFDSIGDKSATFSRISINRWKRAQFLEYAKQRGAQDAEQIFELVAARFGSNEHPLLTRAVLVRRLFDVVSNLGNTQELLQQLGTTPQDYFFNFVDALVTREANDKWLDKSGDAKQPLISVAEHHELLAQISQEMWVSSTFALRHDIVDVIVDLFCDTHGKPPAIRRQIKERIKQHSLLVAESGKSNMLRFDHDDFRMFYLGETLGRSLSGSDKSEILSILAASQLPPETCDQALQHLRRNSDDVESSVTLLTDVLASELSLSYVRDNCSALLVRMLDRRNSGKKLIVLQDLTLQTNALVGRSLEGVEFRHCYFLPTTIDGASLRSVKFKDCEFERIEINSQSNLKDWILENCVFGGLVISDIDRSLFSPSEIRSELDRHSAVFPNTSVEQHVIPATTDSRVRILEKFLRLFMRMTQVDENFVRMKLGKGNAGEFFDNVLPTLLRLNIVEIIPYRGSGVQQRRMRLATRMLDIQEALASCEGSFDRLLEKLRQRGA